MKICFLASASSIHTIRWVNTLVQLGHDISLISLQDSKMDKIDQRVKVYQLKINNKFGYYLNVIEAKMLIRKIKPDVINVHYASGYGTLGRLIKFQPLLLSVWGSDVYLFPNQSKRNEQVLRKNLASANLIASTSKAMMEQTKLFVEPTKPIEITPFGIDIKHFRPQKRIKDEEIIIGTVKSLEKVYGIDILIKSIPLLLEKLISTGYTERAKKIRVKIVGEGSEFNSLVKQAREENLSEIIDFVGAVPNHEVPDYLNQFDIYCAFSRSESFGVAVLEASACEVPVIVSDVGGLPEVVHNEKTGFIVNYKDMNEIVDALYKLVINEKLRNEFGREGRNLVKNKFDWEKNVRSMISLYGKLINT